MPIFLKIIVGAMAVGGGLAILYFVLMIFYGLFAALVEAWRERRLAKRMSDREYEINYGEGSDYARYAAQQEAQRQRESAAAHKPQSAESDSITAPKTQSFQADSTNQLIDRLKAIVAVAQENPVDPDDMSINHINVRGSEWLCRRLNADGTLCKPTVRNGQWVIVIPRRSSDRKMYLELTSALKEAGVNAWTEYDAN